MGSTDVDSKAARGGDLIGSRCSYPRGGVTLRVSRPARPPRRAHGHAGGGMETPHRSSRAVLENAPFIPVSRNVVNRYLRFVVSMRESRHLRDIGVRPPRRPRRRIFGFSSRVRSGEDGTCSSAPLRWTARFACPFNAITAPGSMPTGCRRSRHPWPRRVPRSRHSASNGRCCLRMSAIGAISEEI